MLTKLIRIGDVEIGAGKPLAIQSMTNTDTRDVMATARQIAELRDTGCDIVRFAVPDMEAARAIGAIRKAAAGVPLVADIHFDYRLALESIRQGIDKVRINPGNIGDRSRVKMVADAARERGIPIRIGVNGGSVGKQILAKYGKVTADALVESAVNQAEELNLCGFYDIIVSIKASDVFMTVDACTKFDKVGSGIPQHIGITEAGTRTPGLVKSTIGIYELLRAGIGDTFRFSLTGDPIEEVVAAKALIQALRGGGINDRAINARGGVELISCPTCGRCRFDMARIAEEVERRVRTVHTDRHIKAAVMGCEVNGPGEARDADVGIAGGDGGGLLFKHGKPMYRAPESELIDALMKEIDSLIQA